MKKIYAFITAILMLLTLTACSKQEQSSVKVVCSIFPQYDFLREITRGTDTQLTLLLGAGQESHDYDPSSQDIAAIHACDMFVYVGGKSDSWIDKTLQSVDITDKTVVKLTDLVSTLHEHHDHTDDAYDEHVWTSPKNAVTIVQKLANYMCKADPANADIYRNNAAIYMSKLQNLDKQFADTVSTAKRTTIVVADRFPLLYFCERYGLQYTAAFAGCATSIEPASADVQSIIDTVNTQNIPVVLQMELSAGGVAKTVAENTGCQIRTFYACHNLSKTDFENGETYLSLMQKNLDTLKEALN